MGAEVAVESGAGTLVIDARRGDGPPGAVNYTMSSIITSDAVIERDPEAVAAVVRAIVKTQQALKDDVSLATKVGEKWFPASEAALIAAGRRARPAVLRRVDLARVRRRHAEFQRHMGLLNADVSYDDIVATRFSQYWKS